MSLYFKCVIMHIKSSMQYPASFAMLMFANIFFPVGNVLSIYFLFSRFGSIKGYTMNEVLFCFSVIYFGFSFTEMFLRGFDVFSRQIRQGSFDRTLTRPRTAFLLTAGAEFELTRLTRGLVAVVFMAYSVVKLDVTWNTPKIAVFILLILGAVSVYAGLLLLRASLCFWTVEGLELTNIIIDGGKEVAAYPIDIYNKAFSIIFTYVIPFACVNLYPMLFLLDKTENSLLCAIAPLVALAFFPPCLLVWVIGVKKYTSTGS